MVETENCVSHSFDHIIGMLTETLISYYEVTIRISKNIHLKQSHLPNYVSTIDSSFTQRSSFYSQIFFQNVSGEYFYGFRSHCAFYSTDVDKSLFTLCIL